MTVTLHHGDCLQILPTIEAGSVDAILTDLPYGTTACKWDEIIPFAPMWEQVKRILKPRGVFVTTASQPFTSKLIMSNLNWFKYEWIWVKNRVSGLISNQPIRAHEHILVFCNGATVWNEIKVKRTEKEYKLCKRENDSASIGSVHRQNYKSVLIRKSEEEQWYKKPISVLEIATYDKRNGERHPTQKPVALYEYLIKTYTNEGDTVLDFCMGSGTTLVACVNTGRNGIGVEKEQNYFDIASRRIAQAQAARQLELV